MCRIASSITSLSTKCTDRRSSENELTVCRRSSRASTFSSPIAFRDAVNRQFLSADTSPPCESREMTDLRWEDDSGDDDEFLEQLLKHVFGVELLKDLEECKCYADLRPKIASFGPSKFKCPIGLFDAVNDGYLDYTLIESGLSALQIPLEYKYAKELFNVCDADRDGRIDYHDFMCYMDDNDLELIERNS
ncbi:hypothetical protein LR48_Vigan05g144400 [Vigna angularis]|uniref:EF-hand domain-containing protein n=1 Tax=Phaseolus angularis TaxID=3914 RepID=A0A0L9UMR0_PHAAN|nr:hypothetical protein LR48_Vigan05g144400 [Vigna angularis]